MNPADRLPGFVSIWRRLLLGVVVIVLASATATAAVGFHEVGRIVAAFHNGHVLDLGDDLASVGAGEPQTILILGSDARPRGSPNYDPKVRSDTMILVRLDPAKGATLLSLPRDLKVDIPGFGPDKLNGAYENGGPKLAVDTVARLTGLEINHVIDLNFDGFQHAVNALGCIYTDVDRRYFNDNSAGATYAAIDVPQGYQRMCGGAALAYARYRHDDTDLVRSARQQEILRDLKQQVSVGDLFSSRQRLIDIFGRYTSSDIQSRADVLQLATLAVSSASHPVREVHFQGEVGPSYVTASPDQIHQVIQDFLGQVPSPPPAGGGRDHAERRPHRARERTAHPVPLEAASLEGRAQADAVRSAGAQIPVYYPELRAPSSSFVGEPRVYSITAPSGEQFSSYRMVLATNDLGQYYGVQGTAWKDPPILTGQADVRRQGGRTFEVYKDGDRVRLVAWRTPKAVYWISNTLLQDLSEDQMVAIAESTRPY